jgi:hypothetical protein
MTVEDKPLPNWITHHGEDWYTVDVKMAIEAGETLPIELSKIPQFDDFWANPPKKRGLIDFINYQSFQP